MALGFQPFVDHPLRLFMMTKDLRSTFGITQPVYVLEAYVGTGGVRTMSDDHEAPRDARTKRINMRLSEEALETIRAAAAAQQQDVTSFVLGASLERARAVLAEDRILRMTPHEVQQLEQALDREPQVIPQLQAMLRRFGAVAEEAR